MSQSPEKQPDHASKAPRLRYLSAVVVLCVGIAASVYGVGWLEYSHRTTLRADFERRMSNFSTFLGSDVPADYTAEVETRLNTARGQIEGGEDTAEVIAATDADSVRSDWLNATMVWYPRTLTPDDEQGNGVSYPPAAVAAPDLAPLVVEDNLSSLPMSREAIALASRHGVSIAFGRVAGNDIEGRSVRFIHLKPVFAENDNDPLAGAPEVNHMGFVAIGTQTSLGGFAAQFPMAMGGLDTLMIQHPQTPSPEFDQDFQAFVNAMENEHDLSAQTRLDTNGIRWTLVARPNEEFATFHPRIHPVALLGAGVAVSFLLAVYLLSLQRRSRRIEDLVHERTHELIEANETLAREAAEHRQTSNALRASELRYKLVGEKISDVIWTYDLNWNCTFVSPGIERIRGYTVDEVMEQKLPDMMTPESFADVMGALEDVQRRIAQNGIKPLEYTLELEMLCKDGSTVWTEVRTNLLLSDDGTEILGYLGVTRDISQRKKAESEKESLERQLRQSQKMEAIGVLAGGVAHDFNNLLTGILGYANLLKSKYMDNADVAESADVIEKAAQRAADLTKQLLGFARQGKLQNTQINLHESVDDSVNLLGRTLDKRINIERKFGPKTATVLGDPSQMQLVVLNLAVNARDAMPEGGTLTFRTERVHVEREFCRTHAEARPGYYVRLSVEDTGSGIPQEVRERIFEPFFTTKAHGSGTGMGLATVYGIVKNHGGFIDVYSEVGHGTTFNVYLPMVSESEVLPTVPQVDDPVHGNGTVLVVDDEEVVRRIAERMLTWLGYDVVVVNDGVEALEYYEAHRNEIDLVLIDMVMPRMSGRECFLALKEIDPQVRAILCTGYSRDGAAQEILDDGMIGFVQKPYHTQALSEAVAAALQSNRAAATRS